MEEYHSCAVWMHVAEVRQCHQVAERNVSMRKAHAVIVAQPEAATVVSNAIATLHCMAEYGKTMVSEQFELAARLADLRKTETVLQALLAEISKRRVELETRQRSMANPRW